MDTIPAHILLVDDDSGITEQLSRISGESRLCGHRGG